MFREPTTSLASGGGMVFLEKGAADMARRRLPRSARLVEPGDPQSDFCEFEVVSGNAAYKAGEHFYLTRAQAERAYGRRGRVSAS